MNDAPDTAKSARFSSWWWKVLVVLLIGPLPVAAFAVIVESQGPSDMGPEQRLSSICMFAGALWGLTGGLLCKSLLRSLIGLNLGAVLGRAWYQNYGDVDNVPFALVTLTATGALLGIGLILRRENFWRSLLRGALAGGISLGVLGVLVWIVTKLFEPNLLGWPVMCVVPFSTGLGLFVWLIPRSATLPADAALLSDAPAPDEITSEEESQ